MPLILEQNAFDAEFNVPKSSLAEIQAQIESDLITAIGLLPDTHNSEDLGRANKGAANGLLAKLYLYQDNLAGTIAAGDAVLNGTYPFATDHRDNFVSAPENNPEVRFAIQGEGNWQDVVHFFHTYPRA